MAVSRDNIAPHTWTWLATGAVCLALWQMLGATVTGRLLISQPTLMVEYGRTHAQDILLSAVVTGFEASVGVMFAILIALGFGLCVVFWPRLARAAYPWILASQVIPFVCFAPLIILIFGPGVSGKIVLSALMAIFPIVIAVLSGMREVPASAIEFMRMLAARRWMVVRHVFIPYGLPYFFAGLRTAAPFAVVGAIVAEFNGAEWGVGKDIFIAAKRLEPELMMFGIISGSVLAALLYGIVVFGEQQLSDWYRVKGE